MNKYYVIKLLTNTAGQGAPSVTEFDTYDKAIVNYHQTLATFYNAADVLYAVVEIQNELGNTTIKEIVDHIPEPEPEPEPEEEVIINS